MSSRGLRGKYWSVNHDYSKWPSSKLNVGRDDGYRNVSLVDQDRLVTPARIGLCARPYSHVLNEKYQAKRLKKNENERRPFMNLNMDSPSPTAYNPRPNPPGMTNSPAYTMRPKTYPEKDGGDRVSWGKEWFANSGQWSVRTNYDPENKWPSPADYVPKSTIGWPQITFHQSPLHSIQTRREFTLVSKDSRDFPSPCSYNRSRSQNTILANSPSFTIQDGRRTRTLPFIAQDSSPGPGSYNPNIYKTSQKIRRPAFTISKSPRIIGSTRNCSF